MGGGVRKFLTMYRGTPRSDEAPVRMAQTIRSSQDNGGTGSTSPGAGGDAGAERAAGVAPPTGDSATAATASTTSPASLPGVPAVERARHIVGRLASLPRLARGAGAEGASVAERIARRRRAARATLDEESGARETDWGRVGVFGAGIAIGALIGAGTALLLAPATGYETRTRLARRARHAGGRAAERLDDASDELREKARHGARRVKRAATTSRWAVEDAWERRGRD